MNRSVVYPGQLPLEEHILQPQQFAMVAFAKVCEALLGGATRATGFECTPTAPATLHVTVAPGQIYKMLALEPAGFGTLAADTTHNILKQGYVLDNTDFVFTAPGVAGQKIVYLIQADLVEEDGTPVVLPYYNSSNPSVPFSGVGNNGLSQNTLRSCRAILSTKASAAGASPATPAPDAGKIGLWVVTVDYAQTQILEEDITQYDPSVFFGTFINTVLGDARYASKVLDNMSVHSYEGVRYIGFPITTTNGVPTVFTVPQGDYKVDIDMSGFQGANLVIELGVTVNGTTKHLFPSGTVNYQVAPGGTLRFYLPGVNSISVTPITLNLDMYQVEVTITRLTS